ITKFVNALTVAAEVGGPSASAYLLGYPDHYTGHIFKTFFWKGYVRYAMRDIPATSTLNSVVEDDEGPERVVIASARGSVLPLSKVNDYVFRPRECGAMSLYEFLRRTDVKAVGHDDNSDFSTNDSPDDMEADLPAGGSFTFLQGHPQKSTHRVTVRSAERPWTLNFTGGVLPRPDRGDREEYAFVMLVLFAPGGWRTGRDLLCGRDSFSDAFQNTDFAAEHTRVMRNMNVLYECQDARDDYSA
ncbi:hypothetical protein FKP32DRAFT_1557224, partial [Trametes sanguinea]